MWSQQYSRLLQVLGRLSDLFRSPPSTVRERGSPRGGQSHRPAAIYGTPVAETRHLPLSELSPSRHPFVSLSVRWDHLHGGAAQRQCSATSRLCTRTAEVRHGVSVSVRQAAAKARKTRPSGSGCGHISSGAGREGVRISAARSKYESIWGRYDLQCRARTYPACACAYARLAANTALAHTRRGRCSRPLQGLELSPSSRLPSSCGPPPTCGRTCSGLTFARTRSSTAKIFTIKSRGSSVIHTHTHTYSHTHTHTQALCPHWASSFCMRNEHR